jgi:hypothetical protein
MRVTLNEDQIFTALGDYLSSRLRLSPQAKLNISLTAGRVRGYTADVEIDDSSLVRVAVCAADTAVEDPDLGSSAEKAAEEQPAEASDPVPTTGDLFL